MYEILTLSPKSPALIVSPWPTTLLTQKKTEEG